MALSISVNGHDVTYPTAPAHRHDAPLWDLYYEILSLHARVPVHSVIVTCEGQTCQIIITLVGVSPWALTYIFDDPTNPAFTFEVPTDWRVQRFSATRPLRDKLVAWLAQGTVTEASLVFT